MTTRMKAYLLLVALIAGCVWLLLPAPVGAQGGNAVYNSLRVKIPIERRYLEPQGLQDAAYDLLSADMNIMSSSYQTIMSASVTVGEAGDAVSVHVQGQFGVILSLYLVNSGDLWRQSDPSVPGGAYLVGAFPSGLSHSTGITSHGGALYIVDDSGDELWLLSDPSTPSGAILQGAFPSGIFAPKGITSHGGALYIVNRTGSSSPAELWLLSDPSTPSGAILQGAFPSGLSDSTGITSHGGALYIVDNSGNELWLLSDPSTPSGAILQGAFPSGLIHPEGITWYGGALYVLEGHTTTVEEFLWRLSDPSTPGGAILQGAFPSGLANPSGITLHEAMVPCMVRLARGGTEIEVVSFNEGRVLFDTTFSDAPGVGTHTYNLQVRTEQAGGCTVYRGDGTVPMPSIFVQSYYAGSIP